MRAVMCSAALLRTLPGRLHCDVVTKLRGALMPALHPFPLPGPDAALQRRAAHKLPPPLRGWPRAPKGTSSLWQTAHILLGSGLGGSV